jgi:hypothetical protein
VGSVTEYREEHERAREALVDRAYTEMRDRILADMDHRVREREAWIRSADEATEAFWARLRANGVPTRVEEREAYRRLADEIREATRGE